METSDKLQEHESAGDKLQEHRSTRKASGSCESGPCETADGHGSPAVSRLREEAVSRSEEILAHVFERARGIRDGGWERLRNTSGKSTRNKRKSIVHRLTKEKR